MYFSKRLILTGMTNPAVLLSVSRAVAAACLVWAVFREDWFIAMMFVAYAVVSDIVDGHAAADYPHPWNGKEMNDIPSLILSVAALVAFPAWLFFKHLGVGAALHSDWFWGWAIFGVFSLLATLWFNHHKSTKYDIDHRVGAEVLQGWFYGLIVLAPAAQACYLLIESITVGPEVCWAVFAVGVLILIGTPSHRWFDRPEVRQEYAESLLEQAETHVDRVGGVDLEGAFRYRSDPDWYDRDEHRGDGVEG